MVTHDRFYAAENHVRAIFVHRNTFVLASKTACELGHLALCADLHVLAMSTFVLSVGSNEFLDEKAPIRDECLRIIAEFIKLQWNDARLVTGFFWTTEIGMYFS